MFGVDKLPALPPWQVSKLKESGGKERTERVDKPEQLWCFCPSCNEQQTRPQSLRCSGVAERAGRPWAAAPLWSGVRLQAGALLASVLYAWQGTAGLQVLLKGYCRLLHHLWFPRLFN